MSRAITKELLRELGDWRVDKEARELIAAGRVSEVRYDPPILTGKVGTLTSSLKLGDGPLGIENQCPCRQSRAQGKICAHVVALVYAYLYPWKTDKSGTTVPVVQPVPSPADTSGTLVPLRITVDGNLNGLIVKTTSGTPAELQAVAAAGALRTETQVGHFLANVLPRWQQHWEVTIGERLKALLLKCDYVQPELNTRPVGNDWLAVDLVFKGPALIPPSEARQLLQKGIAHYRQPSGRIALVPTDELQEFDQVIFDCAAEKAGAELRVPRRFAEYLANAAQENKWQPPVTIQPPAEVALPADLADRLRPYQRAGVNWLGHLAANGLGGILADEMGLGKTIQALAWLTTQPRCLVVCPTSLVVNWQTEAARFTPGLKTLLIHGSERDELFAQIPQYNLVITSYALLRRDIERYRALEFDAVILDEAQHIKNRFSQIAQATKLLRANNRLVLTGTPMENSLDELWSIFDFLMPGYLGGAKEFKDRYETPIVQAHDAGALRRLRQRLRPFVLRRTKAEVAPELPPKIEQVTRCELSAEQQAVYQSILDQGRRDVFAEDTESKRRMAVLVTLTRLRQACCHLGLLPGEKQWQDPSTKMDLCFELIEEAMSGGHRVLVFSQFTSLLQLVAATLPVKFCYLDGATKDRAGEVRRFQESADIPVFLISLKAGGTGLNLTGADTVIHLDPWWNPAVEDQATARAHRIGQTNIVTTYKLIAAGTVEEKIVKLQEKKKDLIASTLESEESFVQALTWEELQGLLE